MSKSTACLYPFLELRIDGNGLASPCCAFRDVVKNEGRAVSVYEDSIESIWNADSLTDVRQSMASGSPPVECAACHEQEKLNGSSLRTQMNDAFNDRLFNKSGRSIDDVINTSKHNNFKIPGGPEKLYLQVGTTCNLRCRMCNGNSSSSIAQDPVQEKWMPTQLAPLKWRGRFMTIAPDGFLNVTHHGDMQRELRSIGTGQSIISGRNSFEFPFSPDTVALTVTLQAADNANPGNVLVSLDGVDLFSGKIPSVSKAIKILPLIESAKRSENSMLVIEVTKSAILESVKLERANSGNFIPSSQIKSGKPWYTDRDFVENQLFSYSENLEHLNLMGGEPTMIKEVRWMLRRLIADGRAKNISLAITTNATKCDKEWIELLKQFKLVYVALSMDGFDAVNSYIRAGANWKDMAKNIVAYKEMSNIYLYCHLTLQAYNMFHIDSIAQFCETAEIPLRFYELESPKMLSVRAMPMPARLAAASKLKSYIRSTQTLAKRASFSKLKIYLLNGLRNADTRPKVTKAQLELIVKSLMSPVENSDQNLQILFKQYTAELDLDRGQEFKLLNSELNEFLLTA